MSKLPLGVHAEQEIVQRLKEATQKSFDPANMPSMRTQTLRILRRLCDQIEAAPDNQEFGALTVDFRTGDFNLDSTLTLGKPCKRFVGTYIVDNPLVSKEEDANAD